MKNFIYMIAFLFISTNSFADTISERTYGDFIVDTDLTVDTNTLFVDASLDRVGINTTSPAIALDIDGGLTVASDFTVTNVFEAKASGVTVMPHDFTVDTNTLFVDASENKVGINTVTPSKELDVSGEILATSTITSQGSSEQIQATNSYIDFNDGGSGTITFSGRGNTNNETVELDLETTANMALFTSTTGLNTYDFGGTLVASGLSVTNVFEAKASGVTVIDNNLNVEGELKIDNYAPKVTTITNSDSPFNIDDEVILLCNTAGGAIKVNLPALADVTDRVYHIKQLAAASHVTVQGNGEGASAEKIDAASQVTLQQSYTAVSIVDGQDRWYIY